jgi:hypothetical protein
MRPVLVEHEDDSDMRKFVEHSPMGGYGTLNTLPRHVIIMGKCNACGTMREIDHDFLGSKAGGTCDLRAVGKRLKCRECGRVDGEILLGYYTADQ